MSQLYTKLDDLLVRFIQAQSMFFVATAPQQGHINLSPKGLDALRVLDSNTVAWLNVTGSGNETAAHVLENGRMTLMFCAFSGSPWILRLYGSAKAIHPKDAEWEKLSAHFDLLPGARQIFVLTVEMAQTSCGMAVPLYEFQGQRTELVEWANKKGEDGIAEYWEKKNTLSLDGKPISLSGTRS